MTVMLLELDRGGRFWSYVVVDPRGLARFQDRVSDVFEHLPRNWCDSCGHEVACFHRTYNDRVSWGVSLVLNQDGNSGNLGETFDNAGLCMSKLFRKPTERLATI